MYDRTSGPSRFGGSVVKRGLGLTTFSQLGESVGTLYKSLLLFAMNWFDAHLTILWVRLEVATEGNGLMAWILSFGETPFLVVKLAVGAFAAYVLYRCAHLPLAQRGMRLVLGIYLALMMIHIATGFSTLGWQAPATVFAYFGSLPAAFLASVA